MCGIVDYTGPGAHANGTAHSSPQANGASGGAPAGHGDPGSVPAADGWPPPGAPATAM